VTTPVVALPIPGQFAEPARKKRVLLVDTCRAKREVRAETMRRLGMEVDCAADLLEARCWWRPELYNLVLFHVEEELREVNKFCDDIRASTPAQVIAFLVGKPEYLAASPDGSVPVHGDGEVVLPAEVSAPPSISSSAGSPQRWGILEACRRIAAARFLSDTRSRAIRETPLPPRDLEKKDRKRPTGDFECTAELQNEEMQ